MLTSHVRVHVYHCAVGFGSKNPFEVPGNCKMRAEGLIIDDNEDLEVFIPLYPIPFVNSSTRKSNARDKVGETQSLCWLPQNVI